MRARPEALLYRLAQLSRARSCQREAPVLWTLLQLYDKKEARKSLRVINHGWRRDKLRGKFTLLEVGCGRLRSTRDFQFARARHRRDVRRPTTREHCIRLHFGGA